MNIERILIVGTGTMGQRHLEIARDLFPQAQIALYSESNRKLGLKRVLNSRSEIESFRPELSVIANQASKHVEIANFLASAGSHLFIEKPVSSNLEGIQDLLKLEKNKKLKILVGYNLKFLPSFLFLVNYLENDNLGKILDVQIEVGQSLESWRPGRDYKLSTSASRKDGGGVLRELSHEFDYLFALFGTPNWVTARLGKVSNLEIDVEDIAHIIMGMKNVDGTEFMASLHLDFVRQDRTRKCTVIGTQGTLEWNLLNGSIVLQLPNFVTKLILSPNLEQISETYIEEWKHLVSAINLDLDITNDLKSAVRVLQIILACEKSHALGCKVDTSVEVSNVNV